MRGFFVRRSIGIEFSDDSIVITCLGKATASINVLAAEKFPFRPGGGNEETISEIRRFAEEYGIRGQQVSLSVPRNWGLLRFIDVPSPNRDVLGKLVYYEVERHMPFDVDDILYDFQVVGERGQGYRIALAMLPKVRASDIIDFVKEIPFIPQHISISSFSVLNALEFSTFSMPLWKTIAGYGYRPDLFGKAGELSGCIILGTREIEIALIDGGVCTSLNSVPLGEGDSTDDIWQRMTEEIERSLHVADGRKVEKIVLTGNGADQLAQQGKTVTDIPMHVVNDFKGSQLLASAGAALVGYGLGSMQINMMPGGFRPHLKIGPLITRTAAAAAVLLLISLGVSVFIKEKVALGKVDDYIKRNGAEVKLVEKSLAELNGLEKQKKFLLGPEAKGVSKLDILTELSNIVPTDAWITNLDYKELRNQPNIAAEIVITGFARSSSKLIPILENSPYFKNVEFVGQVTKSTYGEGFRIKAFVELQAVK